MMITRVSVVLLGLCMATVALAQMSRPVYERIPSGITEQWQWSTAPGEHWTEVGDIEQTGEWRPVRIGTSAPYPNEIRPTDQYRWPFIWATEDVEAGKAVYFRRILHVDGQVKAATLRLCSYGDETVVYLNGEQLLELDKPGTLTTVDITGRLRNGSNSLAVAAIRGARNFGLLVMGEAELTWPPTQLKWITTDKLDERESASVTRRAVDPQGEYTPAWTVSSAAMPIGSSLESMYVAPRGWRLAEPGLSLELRGTSYATVQPPGGMPEYSTAYFKASFSTGGAVTRTRLLILGDDGYEVYVNGCLVAVEKRVDRAYIPLRVDVTEYMHGGNQLNTIAAQVTNDWGPGRIHIQPTVTICF